MEHSAYEKKNTRFGIALACLLIVAGAALGWLYYHHSVTNPLSDDAILTADTVNVAPQVAGQIVELNVTENQKVQRGDILFTLDPLPYQLAVDQAEAALRVAEATRSTQAREIGGQQSSAQVADEQITRAQEDLDLAEQSLARLTALLPCCVSKQQVDNATTARDNAKIAVEQAKSQSQAANVVVNTLDSANASVQSSQAALALARHNLADTTIRAFHDGRVVGVTTSTGQVLAAGQPVFTLINTENWYASASFSEVDLDAIKVGSCATAYVLSDRSRPVLGKVDGIGWGVSSDELVNSPQALPSVPKTLNWVRLEQRFPVRIKLIDPPEQLTRIGASAVVVVHDDQSC
ncbi:multidrug transporter subunit MdtN [Rhizobium laguerreae]|uniref:multidrug transporter subunit MdtN n=1 Tax=Rhizobium laguerreae TaxID=1076926 RepID=UPI001C8FAE21|nr:multidrug transporter subunit MdtN [Rhizobium laguerreae]MBY3537551.1 multidrug transporter subunit MdtN [Rhizobium laguerreae]